MGAGAGAPDGLGAPATGAVLRGIVGAGAGGVGAAGGPGWVGSALRVTRTVSFLRGTAEVLFIGAGGLGGCLSSLMVCVFLIEIEMVEMKSSNSLKE